MIPICVMLPANTIALQPRFSFPSRFAPLLLERLKMLSHLMTFSLSGCGQISWDPVNYPLFDSNNLLDSNCDKAFWEGCKTISETEIVVHDFFVPINPSSNNDFEAGPSGTYGGNNDNDFMVVGTIA